MKSKRLYVTFFVTAKLSTILDFAHKIDRWKNVKETTFA
jgi:hypothetical protein